MTKTSMASLRLVVISLTGVADLSSWSGIAVSGAARLLNTRAKLALWKKVASRRQNQSSSRVPRRESHWNTVSRAAR